MIQTFINIFKVPELRNKVLFTLFMLAIYRIGYHVPLPGTDQDQFAKMDADSGRRTARIPPPAASPITSRSFPADR
jgi:preprotein translocase subunit SecY